MKSNKQAHDGVFSQFKSSSINWNQTDRHAMGNFFQFKSFPTKWNQTDNVFFGAHKVATLGPT